MLLSYGFVKQNSYGSPAICVNVSSGPSCNTVKCRAKEKCQLSNGKPICIPDSLVYCHAVGDPHYRTFDGRFYDFQGTCTYTVAKTCGKDSSLPVFNIEAKNENRGSTRVSYVSHVTVQISEYSISLVRNEYGFVRVNNQRQRLPMNLNDGQVRLYQSGGSVLIETDFALKVYYDWNSILKVSISSSFFNSVCGLCGNYNGNPSDDLMTPAGTQAPNLPDFGRSWQVEDGDRFCWHNCNGECKACPLDSQQTYSSDESCGLISKLLHGPFSQCHTVIDPKPYLDNCVYDVCMNGGSKQILCQSIKTYSDACQRSNVSISEWRLLSGCPMQCPVNSEYKLCAQACPATCNDDATPSICSESCVESCQCRAGYVLDEGKCIPKSACGCVYQGKLYSPNEVFWGDNKCEKQCVCNPSTKKVECKMARCKSSEQCSVVNGIQNCYAVSNGTCSASGDPHYITFDGLRYDFQGTSVQVKLWSFDIVVDRKYKDKVLLNGVLTNLPLVETGKLTIYKQGYLAVNGVYFNLPIYLEDGRIRIYQHGIRVLIDTDFGVRVNYDLVYHVIVTVPGNYKEQLGGLCGNYNSDRRDDFQLPDRTVTTDVTKFGASWKVQIPGVACDDGCGGSGNVCPTCDQKKQEIFQTAGYCGFLKKPGGPLSSCYATIDPDPYFNNCIYDLCAGAGDGSILCQSIHSYVAACQAAGVTVQPWRTDAFCPLKCPANSQYKVCADVCSVICAGITDPAKCPETCSEGCECNDGFFFDGTGCVSMSQCGCFEDGRYYPLNERVLSSDCKQACTCSPMGGLICEDTGCAADETCQIKDGVGTCTYILSKYGGGDDGLVPFTIEEKNDNRGTQAVSYVRTVTIYVYGYKIAIMKDEFGKVRVNDVTTNLPVTLLNGKIWARISGANAVVQTDFGLQVTYEYKWHVVITLSSSYYGLAQGICGNFNQNINDERITADNTSVPSILEWVKSWKVKDGDPFCFDYCPGLKCPTCDDAKKNLYGDDKRCGLISKVGNGPFQECHPKINPDNFFASCLYDVCLNGGAKQFLCQALNAYANTCRKQGAQIYDWRTPSGCVLPCPMNSHYEFCGNACPATCTDRIAPSQCTEACVETCQCNDGFVLSGDKCVPVSGCGCTYNGAYYQANHEFWEDDNCRRICKCDPNVGLVVCKDGGCKDGERCLVSNGVRSCQPVSFVTCIGSGDPHYTTFDGKRYDFMGTCIYQLVGVTSTNPSVPHFKVTVQNNNRGGNKAISYTKVVTLEAYDLVLALSMDYTRRILVNGVVTSLPFYYQMNKVVAYMSGSQGIIKTDFDVTVTYDWYSYVAVTISSNYVNSVGGLCGNYNKNPNDDFNMKDGHTATNAVQFGNSWKVGDVPGCSPGCPGSCPVCSEVQKEQYKTEKYCGLMNKPSGPFSKCYSVVDPTPFINDCVFDACQYKGHPSSFCNAIGLYVASCQAAGVRLQEWRSPSFCSLSCPLNSHYELCGNSCPITCYGLSSPAGCDSPCKEACYCDDGYILSGHKCVAIVNCGCVYQEQYYHKNETFYPNGQCREKCQCGADGIVRCKSIACGPEEECKLVNGVWGCRAKESGRCEASGDPHYISFDGLRFDFQGTCTYILSKVLEDDADLVMFSIAVEHEGYGNGKVAVTRLVVVSVYGYTIAIERNMRSKVKVDGELTNLPLVLDDDRILINQEGGNVVLQTDFGLKILYDTIYHVILTVPSTYRGKLGGLCGNFNGDKIDDFRLPSKEVVKNVNEFGVSWKVTVAGAKCSDGCNEGECPVCTEAKLQPFKAASSCGLMTNPSGPFQACHSKISPYEYFNFCVYDSCATDGKDDILCKSLQAYAAVCHAVGVTIATWRSPTFCPMSCPANSHYELCTRSCEQSCSGLMAPMKCTDQCFEGCECNTGYVLDGDHCVTADKCGCAFNGKYMREGEFSVTTDCTIQCKCQAGGVTCTAFTCGDKENCRLVNGVRGCYKVEGECTVNSLKLITFDGLTGGPIGTGPVEVASLCDGKATSWFRVIADLQSCGKAAASVARLHVFLDGSLVTFSKDKEIWVNGRLDRLPVASGILSANAGEESVLIQITADLNIELTTSGNLVVRVSDKLSGLICGACGNFNGNTFDDLKSPGGDLVTDIVELIASWRARDLTSCQISTGEYGHPKRGSLNDTNIIGPGASMLNMAMYT
ncbi:IgGFc-binding protein-like [Leptodactylus fuscus]|uniref:IgGFc-binding protein-like n=1 Tax=Leptodactylus fuscus TaxID=238119 RepID=UPI003F4F0BA9